MGMENGMSPADYAAISGNGGFGGEGTSFFWIFALLILLFGGGFGGFGGNYNRYDYASAPATQGQMTDQFNFEAIRQGQSDVITAIKDGNANQNSLIKDVAYTNLTGIRDVESAVAQASFAQQNCCCETNRNIDSAKFDLANYSAAIQANATANTQKILDAMCQNKTEAMQNRINQLELQSSLCNVVKYPVYAQPWNFNFGSYGCGCGCGCA